MTKADIPSRFWKKSCGPFLPLTLASAITWQLFALGGSPLLALPVLCTGRLLGSLPESSEYAFALNWLSPTQLVGSWVVMLLAMMLPLTAVPIAHIRSRSFQHLRLLTSWAYLLGYFVIWMAAALPLIGLALFMRLLASVPEAPFLAAFLLAIAWQSTPWKQFALNKCHALPPLSSFGTTQFGSSFVYGLNHGVWCLAACSPLMLVTLLAPTHSQIWMVLVALWIWAERLELPRKPILQIKYPDRAIRAGYYLISQIVRPKKLVSDENRNRFV